MEIAERAARFQALHERDQPFVVANPWDVGSARLFEAVGYEALAPTGGGRAFSLGLPDGSTTPEQLFDYIAEITAAANLPLTADLEDGFGTAPETVAATIERAASAGAVGGSIEDRGYGDGNRVMQNELFDLGLAVDRVRAAVEAAESLPHPFVVTARCESFLTDQPDLAETIRRLQAFEEAGAHCVYAPGLQSLDQIRRVVDAVDAPVNVILGRSAEPVSVGDLADAGVQRISIGSGIARAALTTAKAAAEELLERGTTSFADSAISHGDACEIYRPWAPG